MLLKYLLVGILFYFIVKTSRNLIRAVRGELEPSSRNARFRGTSSNGQRSGTGWQEKASRSGATRRRERWEEDIEDAKWEDL